MIDEYAVDRCQAVHRALFTHGRSAVAVTSAVTVMPIFVPMKVSHLAGGRQAVPSFGNDSAHLGPERVGTSKSAKAPHGHGGTPEAVRSGSNRVADAPGPRWDDREPRTVQRRASRSCRFTTSTLVRVAAARRRDGRGRGERAPRTLEPVADSLGVRTRDPGPSARARAGDRRGAQVGETILT
jgi:hypothetical protein